MAPSNDDPPFHGNRGPSVMFPLEVEDQRDSDGKPTAKYEIEGSASHLSGDAFDDVISISIREGTRGLALVSVVAVSTCMAIISFLLLLLYQAPDASQTTNIHPEEQMCGGDSSNVPLWASLMQQQIQVIQNLVHASLLGGAAFVAAFRGDAVWLFFARNCCFFFGLAALSYLAVDIAKGRFATSSFIMSALMSTVCITAFVPLELARQEVASHLERYARGHEANYPKWLPSTRSQLVRTTFITRMAHGVQLVAIAYTILTTAAAILEDCDSKTSISLLESSYREGAHQAFLLALLFHAATSPGDDSRLGGAIVCSAWRLLLGVSYLFPLPQTFTIRETASMAAIVLEILLMLPILVAALLLLRENQHSTLWKTNATSNVQYSRIEEDDMEREDDNETDDPPSDHNRRIVSLSMFQISKSTAFSPRQRRGSFVMWLSSACLLVGMTLECLLLLTLPHVNAPDVYQWGMHVAAMYLFCTHMSVNSVQVYARARYLLAIACPAGSVIAAWQLWQLSLATTPSVVDDHWHATAAVWLFGWRFLCGIGQSIGLAVLHTSEPQRQDVEPDTGPPDDLDRHLKRCRFVLFKVYIPALILNVVAEGYIRSTCSEALISPSTPECVGGDYLMAKHWPGMGLFFHFGGLLFIFAADALLDASYPPSLAISTFFAANVTILLAGDLIITSGAWTLPFGLKLVWMASVGWLWILLQRLWKLRIAELE